MASLRPARPRSGISGSAKDRPPLRRIGLEQEFFLVDESGTLSNQASDFLLWCRREAQIKGIDPRSFKGECARSMVEIVTPPRLTVEDLSDEYLESLCLALEIGRALGLRLYPLGTYPLPTLPTIEDDLRYRVKARTIGYERFLHAGRCAGVHLHLELPPGTIFPDVKMALSASAVARQELLNIYNLATALDPALIALTRSCPFYEGRVIGLATRTAHYRGGVCGSDGVYAEIPEVGALQPYAQRVEDLIEQERKRYRAWFRAMDRAGVERRLFIRSGADRHRASWNPVRLNRVGTVEIRSMDSNYPEIVLATCALVCGATERIRRERLRVEPTPGVLTLQTTRDKLLVPDFDYLSGHLFRSAVTRGAEDPEVGLYLNSIVRFAEPLVSSGCLARLKSLAGSGSTTESTILRAFPPSTTCVTNEEGLWMVRKVCERLEEQIFSLREGYSPPSHDDAPDGRDLILD